MATEGPLQDEALPRATMMPGSRGDRPRPSKQRAVKRIAALVFGLALFFLYQNRLSCTAREARQFLETVPADEITEISIEPWTVHSLTSSVVTTRDRAWIGKLAAALRDPPEGKPPKADPTLWIAFLQIRTTHRVYKGEVSAGQAGVYFFFGAGGDACDGAGCGGSYGTYRIDAIRPLLEQLVGHGGALPR
jgi:hypothetical protein